MTIHTPDEICERLLDAADEKTCIVWYRGHPLPLIGIPMDDGEGGYVLRGAPYGDSIVFEIDAVLPFALIQQQQADIERLSAEKVEVWNAAAALSRAAFTHYRKADGSQGTIEGDDGEMCFIVPHDEMVELRAALGKDVSKK